MAVLRIINKCVVLTVSLLAPGYLAAQGPQFTIQDLGTLPNLPACNATAISQSGNVVGYCTAAAGENLLVTSPQPTTHVFLYSNGAMTDLNITSPAASFPTGVNDSSAVVGGAVKADLLAGTATAAPFIYDSGAIASAPSQIASALPSGVNNAGQVVATSLQVVSSSSLNLNFLIDSHAFLYQLPAGTPAELAVPGGGSAAGFGINASGEIVGAGVATSGSVVTPLVWQNSTTPQTLPLLSGYPNAIATSVNDSGVAAGLAFDIDFTKLGANGTAHAVLFDNGKVTDLGVLSGSASSMALGINDSGTVVGFNSSQPPTFALQLAAFFGGTSGTTYTAFLYSGNKMYDLNSQLVNGTGWQLSFATQINNAGQIAGTGLINGAQHAFLLTPVLSPTIAAGGIVGAGFSTPAVTTISSNGVFSLFGSQLSAATFQPIEGGDIVNNQLPTMLGGTCVESGTTKWNLYFASPTQLNVLAGQLPSSGTVPVTVVTNCGTANEVSSPAVDVTVGPVAPEFLSFSPQASGENPIAAYDASTGIDIAPAGMFSGYAPVHTGDVVTAYGVGWGATSPSEPIGTLDPVASTLPAGSYSLTLGGVSVDVAYIGLSPGSAGLYQVNFTVPAGIPAGNQPLVLTVQDVMSEAKAYIAVAN
jgi:uncharacterized protein (TIGR03437 family)